MSKRVKYELVRPSLMSLNDDCLLIVMEMLHIMDLKRLTRVNKRLRDLCLVTFSRKKELNFSTLFPHKGRALKKYWLKQFLRWCSLLSLELSTNTRLPTSDILNVLMDCASVEILKIEYGSGGHKLFYPYEKIAFGRPILQNLRQLHLCQFRCYLAPVLQAFPNLEELSCTSILIPLSDAGRLSQNKLKSLKIEAQVAGTEMLFSHVGPMFPNLEVFDCAVFSYRDSFCNMTGDFSNNKKLKEIHMKSWAIDDEDLLSLGQSIHGQLETLVFHRCSQITEGGFRNFLATQPNLKVVDIRYYYNNLKFDVLRCLNDYVETRPVNNEPLTVYGSRASSEWSPMLNCVPGVRRI